MTGVRTKKKSGHDQEDERKRREVAEFVEAEAIAIALDESARDAVHEVKPGEDQGRDHERST